MQKARTNVPVLFIDRIAAQNILKFNKFEKVKFVLRINKGHSWPKKLR